MWQGCVARVYNGRPSHADHKQGGHQICQHMLGLLSLSRTHAVNNHHAG